MARRAFSVPTYLEGTYSEIYPEKSQDVDGLREFFKQFSFPGGIGSHCTPETPGSIHEGGELGYVLSHACGAAFDNPELIVAAVVGDGESETGPLATSWHINKFLNPARDGAVLPILHLNGYKIDNPTLLARISHEELENLFRGYGWTPYFVEGSDTDSMHQAMAATVEHCVREIREHRRAAREHGESHSPALAHDRAALTKGMDRSARSRRPLISRVSGGLIRCRFPTSRTIPNNFGFWKTGCARRCPTRSSTTRASCRPYFANCRPSGNRRMSANPHANGGRLKKALRLPDFRDYAAKVDKPGKTQAENTRPLGAFLARRDEDEIRLTFASLAPTRPLPTNSTPFTPSSKKFWIEERFPEDDDGGNLAADGRVMEMLSEHTMEGMLEGYLLTGRHGFFSTYEVIRSRHRFDVQPARQVAGDLQSPLLAASHRISESPDHFDRLAAGSQRLHPSGSRLSRCRRQQERQRHPHLPAA